MSNILNKINSINPFSSERLVSFWIPYPKYVIIDPINICHLKCPLCPTGLRKVNYKQMAMPFDQFKFILDKLPFIKSLELFRYGESFLHPRIFSMIKYANDKGIYVIISSNLSFEKPDEFFDKLIKSGLSKLIISLDGTSEETYSKYRVGGNFKLVYSNMKKIVKAKKRLKNKKPDIIWQFLINRFNEHELPTAQKLAKKINVKLNAFPIDVSDNLVDVNLDNSVEDRQEYWLAKDTDNICEHYKGDTKDYIFEGICPELFKNFAVTVDGKVLPCCGALDKNSVFGDMMTESFKDIWYGENYTKSRLLLLNKNESSDSKTICTRCKLYNKTPSFRDKLQLLKSVYGNRFHHILRALSRC